MKCAVNKKGGTNTNSAGPTARQPKVHREVTLTCYSSLGEPILLFFILFLLAYAIHTTGLVAASHLSPPSLFSVLSSPLLSSALLEVVQHSSGLRLCDQCDRTPLTSLRLL